MEEKENYFLQLYTLNVNDKAKKKANLTYLSWANAWAEVKKLFPDATYKVYHRIVHTKVSITKHIEAKKADGQTILVDEPAMDVTEVREVDNEVNYFSDGNTCWVKVGVIINGIEHIEELPIMDLKNKPVYGGVHCVEVNKAIQRALTKAIAKHGLGLYIYAGEDLPEDISTENKTDATQNFLKLRSEVIDKMNKLFTSPHVVEIEKYFKANFDKRVSECDESYYEKLVAAKQFLDQLN